MSRTSALAVLRRALIVVFVTGMVLGPALSLAQFDLWWVFSLVAISYGLVGLVVTGHRPHNPVGWTFLGAGSAFAFAWLAGAASTRWASTGTAPSAAVVIVALLGTMMYIPFLVLCTTFTVLLYPEGLPSRRWRPVLWVSIVATVSLFLSDAFGATISVGAAEVPNPLFGASFAAVQLWSINVGGLAIAGCTAAGVVSAVMRTWQSTGVRRLQMRWFVASVTLVLVVALLMAVLAVQWAIGQVAIAAALVCVPVSCGVAILRYRLYEIDRIISRTLSYALVTGTLLAVYAGVVTSMTRLLPGTSSSFAVAAATLVVAALFRPILVGSSRVDLQACKLEYSIVSPK